MFKKILLLVLFILIIAVGSAKWAYSSISDSNTNFSEESKEFFIPTGTNYEDLLSILENEKIVKDIASFQKVSGWMNFATVHPGKYVIENGKSNRSIVGTLRARNQKPVNVTFNNVRLISDLSGELARNLEIDSLQLLEYMTATFILQKHDQTLESMMSLFIPNTYEVFWNIKTDELVDRMVKENEKFWSNKDRIAKAEALKMTKEEVYALASIVEKESQHGPERPTIAGLYINRLKRGQPLQADPTVVFATGIYDLRRVLNKHLAFDSPYNTYKNAGLPPGPIYMPSIQSIDAVLDYEKHNYLYMCAKPGFGTKHAFAKTLRGHNKNANQYRSWLNKQGIR